MVILALVMLRLEVAQKLVSGGLGIRHGAVHGPTTKILFATAVPLAEIAVNLAFLTVTTRVLFAQAFDRLLPVGGGQDRRPQPRAERRSSASCW